MRGLRDYAAHIVLALLSVLKGMAVTQRYFVRRAVTLQYPDVLPFTPARERSWLQLDLSICTACKVCEIQCPVNCITIDVVKDPQDKKKKSMTRFDIDMSICMYCSLCCDPCPTGAIFMVQKWDRHWDQRGEMTQRFIPAGQRVEAMKE